MNHHTGQTSSNLNAHSDELQLAVLTQQNKRLTREILPFELKHYYHQDELNLLLNIAKQLRYHSFAPPKRDTASSVFTRESITNFANCFFSYLIEVYGAQLSKGSILFLCDPHTNTNIFLIYDTLFNPLSDTIFEFLNGVWSEIQHSDRAGVFRKSSLEFLKRLAAKLNTAALQSRKKNVHKIARQEIEGFTYLLRTRLLLHFSLGIYTNFGKVW